jgi:hypothetical protein
VEQIYAMLGAKFLQNLEKEGGQADKKKKEERRKKKEERRKKIPYHNITTTVAAAGVPFHFSKFCRNLAPSMA